MTEAMIRINVLLIVLGLFLTACSDNDHSSSESKQPVKTIIDPQLKALEKAKGVEQQLLDAAEQQRKLIDAQENY
jgi:hypothetical protein